MIVFLFLWRRSNNLLNFCIGNWELLVPVLDEKFPPYLQVIPSSENFHAVIERARLEKALKQLPRSSNKQRGLHLRVNSAIHIEQEGEETSSSATIPVLASTHSGAEFSIGIDGRYLADSLSKNYEIITARFQNELDPIVIEPAPNMLAVIMPVRL